ncbi:MAG: hypothetical protein GEU26_19470 [Nitrososphaeraceae archaeon]|nr:hypothetical protein [Nitrososphaeraceae archaeon]
MSLGSYNDRCPVRKLYKYKNRRRPYQKYWFRKNAKDKKGFTRYSSGPKWGGQYDPYKPAFWRTYQPKYRQKLNSDDLLPSGYTRNQTWIALCKSWNGFLLAKREDNHENMKQYAMQIRTLQKELGLPQSDFNMFTPDEMEWMERESDDTLNELRYAFSVPEL